VLATPPGAPLLRIQAPPGPIDDSETHVAPKQSVLPAVKTRIPFTLIGGGPIVEWTDSTGTARRFLLDTGANAVILSPDVAAAQRLTLRDTGSTADDTSGRNVAVPTARIGTLTLGEAMFHDFDAPVIAARSAWDGFLGWPLFQDALLTIDYEGCEFIVHRGGLPTPDGADVLPLRKIGNQLLMPVRLNGNEVWALLDTGWCSPAGLELTAAQASGVRWTSEPVPATTATTPLGTSSERIGRLNGEITIGRHRVPQPVVGIGAGRQVAIVGATLLQCFTVTLDVRNMRVRFVRDDREPIAMSPVVIPGFACDLTRNPAPVTEVLRGSQAEHAGLRAGDLVLEVNGESPAEGMYAIENYEPIVLKLSRNGRQMTLTVPFTKLVP
jgi:predicted aspartyl protease